MGAVATRWARLRELRERLGDRGILAIVAAAIVMAGALVALPLGMYDSTTCRIFDIGCPAKRVGPARVLRSITPLEAATRGSYVALGDSYSSGEGAYNIVADRAFNQGGAERCHRSGQAYFPTVARAHEFARNAAFWACSGARVSNVMRRGQRGEPPQIDRIGVHTSLITISIGGNDLGYVEVLRTCIVKLPWSSACRDQEPRIRARLAGLRSGLRQMLDEITRRSPYARVVVLGYPRPFPTQPRESVNNIGTDDQRWLNAMTRELDDLLRSAAREADLRVTAARGRGSVEFVDAYQAFAGHEIGTADPYLNDLDVDLGELAVEPHSFHPNAAGYQRFAALVNQQIQAGPGRPLNQYRWTAS